MPQAPIPNTPATNQPEPRPGLGPLPQVEGTTSVDAGMSFEVEMAAYESLRRAAGKIYDLATPVLAGREGARIVFLDRPPGEYLAANQAFQDQIVNLREAFVGGARIAESALATLKPKPESNIDRRGETQPAVRKETLGVGAIISGATSLLGLLRADTAYTGRKVAIDPLALAIELSQQWQRAGSSVRFLDSRFFPDEDLSLNASWQADVLSSLDEVSTAREKAFRAIHALSQAVFQSGEDTPGLVTARLALDYARDHFEAPDQILRALHARMHSVDQPSGLSLLQVIRLGGIIRAAGDTPDTWFLFARVVGSGGSYRTVRNLFRLLFMGDGAYHSGGVLVEFALCSQQGGIAKSGVVGERMPYRSVRRSY